MVKKTLLYLLISVLAIFIFSLSQIQALTCLPGTNYYTLNNNPPDPLICLEQNSQYVDPNDYGPNGNFPADADNPNFCGDGGFHFVDADNPGSTSLTLKTTVPKTFNAYKLKLLYRRGQGPKKPVQNNENFSVECDTKSYNFFDVFQPPPDPNDNLWVLTPELNCDLTQGNNDIIITSIGTSPGSSVHFEQFSLEACIPDNYCTADPDCNDNIDCTQDSCVSNTCNNLPSCPPGQYCSQTLGCTPILDNSDGPTAILPFFSLLNLLISALIIIFIYFLVKQKRNNKHKAKTSKRKLKYSA